MMNRNELSKHPGDPGMGRPTQGNRKGLGGEQAHRVRPRPEGTRSRQPRREQGIRATEADNPEGQQAHQARDPQDPATKPHGTTSDQESEMESEGQGQSTGQSPNENQIPEGATPKPNRRDTM